MIEFDYIKPHEGAAFGKVVVSVKDPELGIDFPFRCPLTLNVRSQVSGKILWSCELFPNTWASYIEPLNNNFEILDSEGSLITLWSWDLLQHGDELHTSFYSWCLKNKNSRGIAIGTHNGETGEWVTPIREGIIRGLLVEASEKQYIDLHKNYINYSNVKSIKTLVSTDGRDYDFYESGEGFTNSLSKEHGEKYGFTNIVRMQSISITDLIISQGMKDDCKWLHLDVEGIDSELILSLDDTKIKLPEIILFESLNLDEETKIKTKLFLESKGYKVKEFNGWNTLAVRS